MPVKMKKKSNVQTLAVNLAVPLCMGAISLLISADGIGHYQEIKKSVFAPSAAIFSIIWATFYILMGISAYIIAESRLSVKKQKKYKQNSLSLYSLQLAINFFWPILFFGSENYLFSLLWLILLLFSVLWMTAVFWQIEQSAAYLQIPYILWLTFTGYLNLTVLIMN